MTLSLTDFPELVEDGGWARGIPPGHGVYVLVAHIEASVETAAYAATSGTCTHVGCGVRYDAIDGEVVCPCHGSRFDLDGQVLHGPAVLPLEVYEVEVADGAVRIRIG